MNIMEINLLLEMKIVINELLQQTKSLRSIKNINTQKDYLQLLKTLNHLDKIKAQIEDYSLNYSKEMQLTYNIHIKNLPLSLRTINIILKAGITSLEDLIQQKDKLNETKGFGIKTGMEIETFLRNYYLENTTV